MKGCSGLGENWLSPSPGTSLPKTYIKIPFSDLQHTVKGTIAMALTRSAYLVCSCPGNDHTANIDDGSLADKDFLAEDSMLPPCRAMNKVLFGTIQI